jgi:hypothetical protein
MATSKSTLRKVMKRAGELRAKGKSQKQAMKTAWSEVGTTKSKGKTNKTTTKKKFLGIF